MPDLLTIQSAIQCPHGGTATLQTANAKVSADGAFALLESDVSVIAGCPFTIGPKYSPCVQIQWTAGSTHASAAGPVLTMSSVGMCLSPEGAPQGVAIISNTQAKVSAQ